jgi:hypothetical protein
MANDSRDTDITKKLFLKLLEKNWGLVSKTCSELNISRQAYYNWMDDDPNFKRMVDDTYELVLDKVEQKLFEKIDEKSEKSIHFYLKHKGRKRGYEDFLNIETNQVDNIEIKILKNDDDKITIQKNKE